MNFDTYVPYGETWVALPREDDPLTDAELNIESAYDHEFGDELDPIEIQESMDAIEAAILRGQNALFNAYEIFFYVEAA